MIRFAFLFLTLAIFSCKRESQSTQKVDSERNESAAIDDADTSLSPEETFSYSLVQNILGAEDEGDLEIYLEDQIYPIVSKSNKVTIDKVSSSAYMLSYEVSGSMKNIFIQKFYNPVLDEFVFEKFDTMPNKFQDEK